MSKMRIVKAPEIVVLVLALFVAALVASHLEAAQRTLDSGSVTVEEIADGLHVPWSIAFLPGCEFIVTERRGRLYHFDSDLNRTRVNMDIKVFKKGQGGLLDVLVGRDFETNRRVYLSYSYAPSGAAANTAVSVGELTPDNRTLVNTRRIFEAKPKFRGGRHFGSRLVMTADSHLFVTVGDRGNRNSAQDLSAHNGSVIRVGTDGRVPADNPFAGQPGRRGLIWSYGHRNAQGAALDAEGNLWIVEHGARGGDEINRIIKGRNYGWPVIAYGRHYSGRSIGEGHAKPGMEQPALYWDPSIAPSGLLVYSGKLWPLWKGNLFVGSLKFDMISRIEMSGGLREMERISLPETQRVRDVREAPDGSLWFLAEDLGAVFRMVPHGTPADKLPCH